MKTKTEKISKRYKNQISKMDCLLQRGLTNDPAGANTIKPLSWKQDPVNE
jgi:hypothetical protein